MVHSISEVAGLIQSKYSVEQKKMAVLSVSTSRSRILAKHGHDSIVKVHSKDNLKNGVPFLLLLRGGTRLLSGCPSSHRLVALLRIVFYFISSCPRVPL